jgi:hypothetical protein
MDSIADILISLRCSFLCLVSVVKAAFKLCSSVAVCGLFAAVGWAAVYRGGLHSLAAFIFCSVTDQSGCCRCGCRCRCSTRSLGQFSPWGLLCARPPGVENERKIHFTFSLPCLLLFAAAAVHSFSFLSVPDLDRDAKPSPPQDNIPQTSMSRIALHVCMYILLMHC